MYLFIVAGLASARIAVLLAHDVILESLRHKIFLRFPPMDNPILGFDYQQKDRGGERLEVGETRKWYMVSELLTCTRCLTVWITPAVFLSAREWPHAMLAAQVAASMSVASWAAKKL